jgi:hypothetical protein
MAFQAVTFTHSIPRRSLLFNSRSFAFPDVAHQWLDLLHRAAPLVGIVSIRFNPKGLAGGAAEAVGVLTAVVDGASSTVCSLLALTPRANHLWWQLDLWLGAERGHRQHSENYEPKKHPHREPPVSVVVICNDPTSSRTGGDAERRRSALSEKLDFGEYVNVSDESKPKHAALIDDLAALRDHIATVRTAAGGLASDSVVP